MRSSSAPILSRVRAVSGFSFVELAVGMAVLGIVLSGGLMAASKKWGADQRAETRQYLRDTKAALLDYARKNGRLPMMDTSGDGVSESSAGDAPFVTGWLPYKTLGVKDRDAFGRKVQYVVNWQLTKSGEKPCKALKNYYKGKVAYPRYYYYDQWNPQIFTLSFDNSPAGNNWPYAIYHYSDYKWDNKWNDSGFPTSATTTWFPVFKTGQHYEYFSVAALLVSSANDGAFVGPDLDNFYSKTTVPYDFSPANDDIKLELSLPEIYAALECSN